jgi:hypothetical protein
MDTFPASPLPPSSPPPAPAPPSGAAPAEPALERDLQRQAYLVRVLMLVVTVLLVTTTLSLFHQIRWLVAQANQLNVTIQELARGVGDYETNIAPQMNRFYTDLQRLAQANAEYARLFARYQVTNLAAAARSNASTPPAPPR